MKNIIKIDVVSDVACPWCYIGKKRLENAMETLKEDFDFEVSFRPYQLDPSIPEQGKDWTEYFEGKFGSIDRIDSIFHRVESAGKSVGVKFDFKAIPTIPNTLALHLILAQAKEEGLQKEVANTLFDAYMILPQDLTKMETLQNIMEKFGWSLEKTQQLVSDSDQKDKIKAQIHQYQQMGVTGVPFFIINDKYGISGAQPEEVLIQAFQSLQEAAVDASSNSCDVDGQNC